MRLYHLEMKGSFADISTIWLPKHDQSKDGTSRDVNMEAGNLTVPQHWTKNCRQLKNDGSGRNRLPWGRTPKLITQVVNLKII